MSTPADWLTVDDVAAYLDLPGPVDGDDNLALSTAAVKAAVEERRSDLWTTDDPAVFAPTLNVKGGATIWAAIVYQARSAPSGFSGYGDETWVIDSLGSRRSEVMRMIGWRRPELA